ncbi:MAG: dTDP-4-dehydrorhamnose reductase [Chloroflexi bacterium]|nr:dTDP-4-dehydrorhamnose reductase [Chloroflexota bacterium]
MASRPPRILITGGGGQIGIEIARQLDEANVTALGRSALDVTSGAAMDRALGEIKPNVVIHAAAMTDPEACERDRGAAQRVNVVGAWNVARAVARAGAEMVYLSTSYVFGGDKLGPYREYDEPGPINAYGVSKLGGERAARQALDRLYVVRSGWVYSRWNRGFVARLLELADDASNVRYVGDQVANPTSAGDLAAAILRLIDTQAYGVHHLVNEGATSWYGWATAVLRAAGRDDVELDEISAEDFQREARLPANSELANEMARAVGLTLRPWHDALEEFVRQWVADRG